MVIISDSPLTFVNNVEIEEMNLIPETQYIYYKLKDKDTNKKYYGFIDIEKNKVLYNIESEFTKFIPVSNHEMLAINSTSAYKICIIKSVSDGNTYCSETCSSGELILDADGNKCQTGCDSGKVKLMPDNYCIKKSECDRNIYELNSDETICGLCSYFNNTDNGAKYKFINTVGCLTTIPGNADFYNEKLNILKCKTNIILIMGNASLIIVMNLVQHALKFLMILMTKNVYLVNKDIHQTTMEIVYLLQLQ